MIENQINAYRALASAVIVGAIDDIKYIGPIREQTEIRRNAKEFLTGEKHSKVRAIWLSWLDLDECELRRLVLAKEFRGATNQLKLSA